MRKPRLNSKHANFFYTKLLPASKERQKHPEDVDNIQENLNGCKNMVFWRDFEFSAAHDHLKLFLHFEKSFRVLARTTFFSGTFIVFRPPWTLFQGHHPYGTDFGDIMARSRVREAFHECAQTQVFDMVTLPIGGIKNKNFLKYLTGSEIFDEKSEPGTL